MIRELLTMNNKPYQERVTAFQMSILEMLLLLLESERTKYSQEKVLICTWIKKSHFWKL